MPKSDYFRPASYQIKRIYRCKRCGHEQEIGPQMRAQMPCPCCGGFVEFVGEAYPGDADEWDEVKVNGQWINKQDIPGY